MATDIKCPNCQYVFVLGEAEAEEYKKELREQMNAYKKQKEEELLRKEQDWQQQLQKSEEVLTQKMELEKSQLQKQLEEKLRKSITESFQIQMEQLQQNNKNNEEKLKEARQKEAEFLRKEQDLKTKEAEMDIYIQKQLLMGRDKLSEDLRKIEELKMESKETDYKLKIRELEKKNDDTIKLLEEAKKKNEQGSTQLQGESQELLLEEILHEYFPFDSIQEVGKGIEGADCIQIVRNQIGKEFGKIIYESKRAKTWKNDWIEKLKTDMRTSNADVAILVTHAFPKDMDKFGEKDGIWVCSFELIGSVAAVLRNTIVRISEAKKWEENKGEKMQLLYNFLTGNEFRQQVEAIAEGFMAMKISISKERIQMEKLWKEREKQLDKVLMSTSGMYGSVKGIVGASISDIPLLDGPAGEEEDDLAH